MARTFAWRSAALAAFAAAAFACKEEVTAPGDCPELCAGDSVVVADTILTGIVASDTSIRGFTRLDFAPILVASGTDSLTAYPIIRFGRLPQRWFPSGVDTSGVTIGTIDSVALELRLEARDTLARNLKLLVYRLSPAIDTLSTFDSVSATFAGPPIDTVPIADSLRVAQLRRLLPVASITPQQADSYVVAIGIAVIGDSQTAVRLSSVDGVLPPVLRFYVHGAAPRDTFANVLTLVPAFDSYVQTPAVVEPPSGAIVVGDQPAARAFLRFQIPTYFVDSVTVIRATLQLTPTRPVRGFDRELFTIEAMPVLKDFGGKSLLFQDSTLFGRGTVQVGQTGTVEIEMAQVIRLWRGIHPDTLPRMVSLRNRSEIFIYNQLDAAGRTAGASAPRLRISYLKPFRIGVP